MYVILQDRCWVVQIPFVRMVKFQFLAQFPVDHLTHPVLFSLILFGANLLHSLIMWLIISSLSPHNLHRLFCCVVGLFTPWEYLRWNLSDSKSPQVSRTLLSILTVLDNVIVWMVSSHLLIFKSSCLFNNPLVNEPRAPIIIGINVTFMFHSFSILEQGPRIIIIIILVSISHHF